MSDRINVGSNQCRIESMSDRINVGSDQWSNRIDVGSDQCSNRIDVGSNRCRIESLSNRIALESETDLRRIESMSNRINVRIESMSNRITVESDRVESNHPLIRLRSNRISTVFVFEISNRIRIESRISNKYAKTWLCLARVQAPSSPQFQACLRELDT